MLRHAPLAARGQAQHPAGTHNSVKQVALARRGPITAAGSARQETNGPSSVALQRPARLHRARHDRGRSLAGEKLGVTRQGPFKTSISFCSQMHHGLTGRFGNGEAPVNGIVLYAKHSAANASHRDASNSVSVKFCFLQKP